MMTKLITIPKFAEATGLPYRLCLQLIGSGHLPSIPVGRRRRIDVRWVEQWLAGGGYRPSEQDSRDTNREAPEFSKVDEPRRASR
jgi:excisionase family DNA binding protein